MITRVLPVPAPARTSTGPSVAVTASRCLAFNCSSKFMDECGERRIVQIAKERFYRSVTSWANSVVCGILASRLRSRLRSDAEGHFEEHQRLIARNNLHVGDVQHRIRDELEVVVHVEKQVSVNRRHRRDHVGVEGEWPQRLGELVRFFVLRWRHADGQALLSCNVRRSRGINNQPRDLSRAERFEPVARSALGADLQPDRARREAHRLRRLVAKRDVQRENSNLVWILLPENFFGLVGVNARNCRNRQSFVPVLTRRSGWRARRLLRVRRRQEREKRQDCTDLSHRSYAKMPASRAKLRAVPDSGGTIIAALPRRC